MNENSVDNIIGTSIKNYLEEYFHGSGIDGGYKFDGSNSKNILITSSFHCMNEHGYYDGWQDFKPVISKDDINDFKLQFTGHRKENYIYTLRDYLEDSFAYQLGNFADGAIKEYR